MFPAVPQVDGAGRDAAGWIDVARRARAVAAEDRAHRGDVPTESDLDVQGEDGLPGALIDVEVPGVDPS